MTAATWPRVCGPVHTSALGHTAPFVKTLITSLTANDGSWTERHYYKPEQTTCSTPTIQNTSPTSRFSSLMVRTFILLGSTHLCSHVVSLTVMTKLGKNLYFKRIIATSSARFTPKVCTAKLTPVHRHHRMLLCSGIARFRQERRSASPPFVQSCVLLAVLLALICDTASCRTAERPYRIKSFPSDNSKPAEMVFYLWPTWSVILRSSPQRIERGLLLGWLRTNTDPCY